MATSGTYLEEYLDGIALLPSEMKRSFELMKELDEDSQLFLDQLRVEQATYF